MLFSRHIDIWIVATLAQERGSHAGSILGSLSSISVAPTALIFPFYLLTGSYRYTGIIPLCLCVMRKKLEVYWPRKSDRLFV